MEASDPGRHILLLGYSRIARRRIIPALLAAAGPVRLDIASRRSAGQARSEQRLPGDIFDSYEAALRESRAPLVYVSLANGDHARWAEAALDAGRHVIVDKPAFLSQAEAGRLAGRAREKKLLLAEATVFSFHPQIDRAREAFRAAGCAPERITAVFSFPGFEQGDFRYCADCGGGALNDLGPYAIGAGTVFFDDHPSRIFCRVTERGPGVDLAFSMMALYRGGRSMVGHFGFNTEYQNTISILGPKLCVAFDRVFTIPADYENRLRARGANEVSEIAVPASDCFADFFSRIFADLHAGRISPWHELLLRHAVSLEMLKSSALQEDGP